MADLTLYSLNTNSVRSAEDQKRRTPTLSQWIAQAQPDVVCLQEVKLPASTMWTCPGGYTVGMNLSSKAYAGVATISRVQGIKHTPIAIQGSAFGDAGRVLQTDFDAFTLLNVYVPSRAGNKRWTHKVAFLQNLLTFVRTLIKADKPLVICGDFNIAHDQKVDIQTSRRLQFRRELNAETDWVNALLNEGFTDTFRNCHPHRASFTWRHPAPNWRLDYIFASAGIVVKSANIHLAPVLSDHCLISATFTLP